MFTYFVPVLIPLFLFKADLRRMLFESTRLTMAFLLASFGTIAGVIVAVALLDLDGLAPAAALDPALAEAAIAGLFASAYIGGSVNYAALGEITGLRADASFFSAVRPENLGVMRAGFFEPPGPNGAPNLCDE